MKSIYPKIDSLFTGIHKLKKYIDKYQGVEIQIMEIDEDASFLSEDILHTLYSVCSTIKEVTLRAPLHYYNLEMVLCKDKNIILNQLAEIRKLSKDLNIHINLLYRTDWSVEAHKECTLLLLREFLSFIKGYDICILLENSYKGLEKECSVLKLCKLMGDPQLKVCLDLSHIYCLANIYQKNMQEFMPIYLNREDCMKYVHQVHFSYTPVCNGHEFDKRHSVVHPTLKEMISDMELLYAYGMYDSIFVPSIREYNYIERKDQITEIENMESIYDVVR